MRLMSSALLMSIIVFVFGSAAAADASGLHPLFVTQSGGTLSFTSTGGALPLLRALSLGGLGTVSCEKSAISGEVVNQSTLAHKIELEFSGHCLAIVGSTSEKCTEPIKPKLLTGELGLVSSTNKKAVLLLLSESGTEFETIVCGATTTVLEGAIIGEFPEAEYNEERTNLELIFQSENKSESQKITEIFLSETQMTGIGLKATGLFGGNASEEVTETLKFDGEALISTGPRPPRVHPFFLAQSGKNLGFTGSSGKSVLKAEQAGVPAEISCEKSTSSGELINESTLARKIELEFSGKCVQKINGGAAENCTEPIQLKLLYGELGLVKPSIQKDALFLQPESGTAIGKFICGGSETKIGKAIVGEFPEATAGGTNQYNQELTSFELRFEAKEESNHQKLTEIFLLGTQMTKVELSIEGFLGGPASEESTETIKTEEQALIVSGPKLKIHPRFFTQSAKELLFSGSGSRPVLRGEVAGVAASIECEKILADGFALHLSTLAHRVSLTFHGKCVQKIGGGANETCTEPLVIKKLLAELGLLSPTNHKVVLLLAPSDGTTSWLEMTCAGTTTTFSGALVGEIPETNASLEKQINTPRSEVEVVFATLNKNNHQSIKEIFLLGVQMTGPELKAMGLWGGPVALEGIINLKNDGTVEISTTKE